MPVSIFKYLSPFLIYLGAYIAFLNQGFSVWTPLLYSWVLIPLIELFLKADPSNLSEAEEAIATHNKCYDYLLYAVVPVQYGALALFLYTITFEQQSWVDILGKTMVMGLLCGVFGINVGHELGHRVNRFEQFLARALLLTSLYMHFFIEHNKGHHKRVATPEDPGSARRGESLYRFHIRSIVFSYFSAWQIAIADTRKKGVNSYSLKNEMIRYHIIQFTFLAIIFIAFGLTTMLLFVLAALNGILLLETVNYIEHYGLQRRSTGDGKYERAMPHHSWNSDHIVGRVMLFELSRHSDHHYLASRKYQVLRHHQNAPQMPTGYPGMMILALLPPLWFSIMDKRIDQHGHHEQELKPAHTSPSILIKNVPESKAER